jgi:hypothetical protein
VELQTQKRLLLLLPLAYTETTTIRETANDQLGFYIRKFATLYGIEGSITVLTKFHNWATFRDLSVNPAHSFAPYFSKIVLNIILTYMLRSPIVSTKTVIMNYEVNVNL